MSAKRTKAQDRRQGEFFAAEEMFPVRAPLAAFRPVDLSLRIKMAMSRALKECDDSAAIVAARITEMTGREISVDALYAYTAASKPEHDMGVVRFIAFVRATGARWLWDELLRDDGLTVLEGREAILAEIGLAEQEQARWAHRKRAARHKLVAEPVLVSRRRGDRA